MQVITLKPVTIGKKKHPVGTKLDLPDDTAQWLIGTKSAQAAGDDQTAKAPKPSTAGKPA